MTVTNKFKPVVDLEAMEAARLEEEANADKIIEKVEKEDEDLPEKPAVEPKVPEKPAVDWEAKFKASAQEAAILAEKVRLAEEEKNKKIVIDDAFLKSKYPDWDDLSLGEQRALTRVEEQSQEIQEIKNNTNKFNNDREWQEKVETWLNEDMPDQFPDITGREEEFKRYATRPTRKGLPFEILGKIFIADNPIETPKKKNLFHAPGSNITPEKNEGMTADEAAELMRTKPLEYMRLVKAKKLKIKLD